MRAVAAALLVLTCSLLAGAPARAQDGAPDPADRPPLIREEDPGPPPTSSPRQTRPLTETERRLQRRGWGFDVQLQGGYGIGVDADLPRWGLGRLRLGALHVAQPWVVSFGVTGEVGGLSDGWGVGLQADMLSTATGFVVEAGGAYVNGDAVTLHGAIGWSIFAVEYQWRSDEQLRARHAFFLKLRVPIGLLLFFLL